MTAERQLFLALERIAREKGRELDVSAKACLEIPLQGPDALLVPMVILSTAPED